MLLVLDAAGLVAIASMPVVPGCVDVDAGAVSGTDLNRQRSGGVLTPQGGARTPSCSIISSMMPSRKPVETQPASPW